jgi:plasmid stabilization system protein ParE
MMRQIEWSPAASQEFREHLSYIAEHSPTASRLVRERVQAAVEKLRAFQTGRKGRVDGTSEVYVSKTSLIVIYEFEPDGSLTILRVIHASRDFKPGSFPPAG